MDASPLFHDQLLATKFVIPASSHALIPRPRLTALLNMSLECPLTLVSAPAGFGKTTLLSTWVQSLPPERPRIAWVSLDEGDNEPVLFWMYVLTALDSQQPGLCTQIGKLPANTTDPTAAFRPADAHQSSCRSNLNHSS